MSEERATYGAPVMLQDNTPEARLVEMYRRLRQERGGARRWLFIAVTPDGGVMLLRGEPCGIVQSES